MDVEIYSNITANLLFIDFCSCGQSLAEPLEFKMELSTIAIFDCFSDIGRGMTSEDDRDDKTKIKIKIKSEINIRSKNKFKSSSENPTA